MDKELIEHITTQLKNHEENYAPGAWERFSEKEKKKPGVFVLWPLGSAAAIILILSGLFFFYNGKNMDRHTFVKSKTKNNHLPVAESNEDRSNGNKLAVDPSKILFRNDKNFPGTKSENTLQLATTDSKKQNPLYAANQVEANIGTFKTADPVTDTDAKLASNSAVAAEVKTPQDKPKASNKITFEDLLAQDSKTNEHKKDPNKENRSQKWQQDVYVAPSMGNDSKVNMNYGFSFSYAIANKLSISSGVSYASVSSTESQNASVPQTLSGKNLESVNAKVSGINVPLELRYKISDKLYTGVGISALAVLNNSQQNTYIVNQVQSMSSPAANGTTDVRSFIVAGKQTEPQPESKLDPDKYIGFYNFSLGYKQKISKKNNIAIEPFLRLPMKTFSRESLNLTNGGLRLKVDF